MSLASNHRVRPSLKQLRLLGLALIALALVVLVPSADAGRYSRGGKGAAASPRAKARAAKRSGLRPRDARSAKGAPKGALWKPRRTQSSSDSGLKDHAARHSELAPKEYLARGQANIKFGRTLKGGGRDPNARYHIRKLPSGEFSVTITNKGGKILSIDTWKAEGKPLTQVAIQRGLKASGVAVPKKFWSRFEGSAK